MQAPSGPVSLLVPQQGHSAGPFGGTCLTAALCCAFPDTCPKQKCHFTLYKYRHVHAPACQIETFKSSGQHVHAACRTWLASTSWRSGLPACTPSTAGGAHLSLPDSGGSLCHHGFNACQPYICFGPWSSLVTNMMLVGKSSSSTAPVWLL